MKQYIPQSIIENKKTWVRLLLMSTLLSIFSFPEINLVYNIGIDPPLTWLYNHLFSTGLTAGKGIIFPHGPLAFFMNPLEDNFILALLVTIVLQMVFVFNLFFLIGGSKKTDWLLTAMIAFFIFSMSNFNQLILSNISVSYLLYFRNQKPANKYWGLILTALAFYIKAYLAILCGTLTFSMLIIDYFRNKNIKNTLFALGTVFISMLLLWLVMYGTLGGFIGYCTGMFHLAGDNSAAAAFHPKNNWLFLSVFLLVVFVIPFVQKSKEATLFGCLFVLSFFAAWKYGMAREDYYHVRTYLFFTVISLILFLIYSRKNLIYNISAIVIASVLFAFNMKHVENAEPLSIRVSGIKDFVNFTTSYSEIKKQSREQNLNNIASKRLPEEIRKTIGDKKTDIYPWDYTILEANKLNWQPRPIIQSYAAYTQLLDEKNAAHFRSMLAPQFLIFDLNKTTYDLNGNKLESIDNRYLPNDEPRTFLQIIENYEMIWSNDDFLVLKKRVAPVKLASVITKKKVSKWHEWIQVPDSASNFTRLKVHIKKNFSGMIKNIIYKDELYYLYYKTTDGQTMKYRFVPKNAEDGVWISPFYTKAGIHPQSKKISHVMLMCSDKSMVNNPVTFEWEYFSDEQTVVDRFFTNDSIIPFSIYLEKKLEMAKENKDWKDFNPKKISNFSYYKQKAYKLDPEIFSPSFSFYTDSLPKLPARIEVDCWLKSSSGAKANLVIETENETGEKNWHGIEINRQIINPEALSHIFNFLDLSEPKQKVTVYIWNNGKKSIMIYGLDLKVRSTH